MIVGILIYRSIDCTKVRMPPMSKGSRICKVGQTTERAPWLSAPKGRPRPQRMQNGSTLLSHPTICPWARGLSWACKCFGHGKGDTWKLVGIACTFKTLDGCNDDGFTNIYIYIHAYNLYIPYFETRPRWIMLDGYVWDGLMAPLEHARICHLGFNEIVEHPPSKQ